jgi:hypothetical protein
VGLVVVSSLVVIVPDRAAQRHALMFWSASGALLAV